MIGQTCACGEIHPASHVIPIGRFRPGGPIGWRALTVDAPTRKTRAEAMSDVCPEWTP